MDRKHAHEAKERKGEKNSGSASDRLWKPWDDGRGSPKI